MAKEVIFSRFFSETKINVENSTLQISRQPRSRHITAKQNACVDANNEGCFKCTKFVDDENNESQVSDRSTNGPSTTCKFKILDKRRDSIQSKSGCSLYIDKLPENCPRQSKLQKNRKSEMFKGFSLDEINISERILRSIYRKINEIHPEFLNKKSKGKLPRHNYSRAKNKVFDMATGTKQNKKKKIVMGDSVTNSKRSNKTVNQNRIKTKRALIKKRSSQAGSKTIHATDYVSKSKKPTVRIALKGFTVEEIDKSIKIYQLLKNVKINQKNVKDDSKLNFKRLEKSEVQVKSFKCNQLQEENETHAQIENLKQEHLDDTLVYQSLECFKDESLEVLKDEPLDKLVSVKIEKSVFDCRCQSLCKPESVIYEVNRCYRCQRDVNTEAIRCPIGAKVNIKTELDFDMVSNPSTHCTIEDREPGFDQSQTKSSSYEHNLFPAEKKHAFHDQKSTTQEKCEDTLSTPMIVLTDADMDLKCIRDMSMVTVTDPRQISTDNKPGTGQPGDTLSTPIIALKDEYIDQKCIRDTSTITVKDPRQISTDIKPETHQPGAVKYVHVPRFHPPRSPHNLIEEVLYHDPWALLVATIFLNKTSLALARPYILAFLKDHASPFDVLRVEPHQLEKYFVNIGLKKRATQVWRMSHDFLHKRWKNVGELYGIGQYGQDAYRMFCLGDFNVQPKDRFLKIYKAWYEMTEEMERRKLNCSGGEVAVGDVSRNIGSCGCLYDG